LGIKDGKTSQQITETVHTAIQHYVPQFKYTLMR